MSSHHGHHRSSHHSRSRMHYNSSSHYSSMQNRSRTSSSNAINDGGGGGIGSGGGGSSSGNNNNSSNLSGSSTHRGSHLDSGRDNKSFACGWQEHKSSSGKVYYYHPKSGVSQWEVPLEMLQQQQQQQQQHRPVSPESELSESSSIRQQQDNSPSSNASSHHSVQSDSIVEDKPLLTPSLVHYYKPEVIMKFSSSQGEELEQQASQISRETLLLSEKLLEEKVEIMICKMRLEHVNTQLEAQKAKCSALRKTIEKFGIPNYQ